MKEWRKFILEATQIKEGKEHILVGDWRWGGQVHGHVRYTRRMKFLVVVFKLQFSLKLRTSRRILHYT